MRGSPAIKTLLVLAALIAVGLGLRRLEGPARPFSPSIPAAPTAEVVDARFFLTLSAEVDDLVLESADEVQHFQPQGHELRGEVRLEKNRPVLFLRASRADGEDQRPLFAKLTIEPPGRPTLTRIFDGLGHIDQVWEPRTDP